MTDIKQVQQELGYTNRQMAQLMGVHYETYGKWKRGNPTAGPQRFAMWLRELHRGYPEVFEVVRVRVEGRTDE